jgi:hypothetical protein
MYTPKPWSMRVRFAGKLPPHEVVTKNLLMFDPMWGDEQLNRQLESIEFFLPNAHKIVLSGMEAYNFFVEVSQAFGGKGGARIEAFFLAGKLPGQDVAEMWRIGNGKVVRDRKSYGEEWGGTATRGWKLGVVGNSPVSAIMEG